MSRHPSPHLPQSRITLDEKSYRLCFDFGAIALAEQELVSRGHDVRLLEGLPPLTFATSRIMFAAAIARFHPEIEWEAAVELTSPRNVYMVYTKIAEAWREASPAPKPHAGKPDRPPKDRLEQWLAITSFAKVDLGVDWEEMASLTPRLLSIMAEQYEMKLKRREVLFEFMVGQAIAMIGNSGLRGLEKALRPEDFMPTRWHEQRQADAKRRPCRGSKGRSFDEQLRRTMQYLVAYQNGQVAHGFTPAAVPKNEEEAK